MNIETATMHRGNFNLICTYSSVDEGYKYDYVVTWDQTMTKTHVIAVGSGASNFGGRPTQEDLEQMLNRGDTCNSWTADGQRHVCIYDKYEKIQAENKRLKEDNARFKQYLEKYLVFYCP